ncbi:hypothetical protein ANCDUO_27786 [Ancylostoma duodenale]|uniref:Metallo-beta-lactamase domain-containing protein n=1 Tax=Ancylostoma duodenale TaxID=51022 RepID=A0A0C2FAY6_9BILA|nr:hypothetical protein ANCDUO_27786 [Ancylostoma duodenale]
MASDIAVNGEYNSLSEENPIMLTPDVDLHRCPGHTDHDLIVVVRNTELGCVVVAGDIFESEDDADQWKAVSAYPEKQEKSREKILELADWIIPGQEPYSRTRSIARLTATSFRIASLVLVCCYAKPVKFAEFFFSNRVSIFW